MRIKTLRSLCIALIFVLVDIPLPPLPFTGFEWRLLPDILGLPFVLACSVLLITRAPRFSRPVVLSCGLIFLEVVRIFSLVQDETAMALLSMVYLFLRALLLLSLTHAVSEMCHKLESHDMAVLAERIGYVYAMVFPLQMGRIFFENLAGMFWLLEIIVTALTLLILFMVYNQITLPLGFDADGDAPLPQFRDDEETVENMEFPGGQPSSGGEAVTAEQE